MELNEKESALLKLIRAYPAVCPILLDFTAGRIDADTFTKAINAVLKAQREVKDI